MRLMVRTPLVQYLASLPLLRKVMLALAGVTAIALAVITFAVHDAKHRILQALGPRTTVGSIRLDYPTVTLRDVRIAADAAPGAWPSREEFHAALVQVRIDAHSLWAYRQGAPLHIASVRVEDGTLVIRKTRDGLDMLSALRETTRANAAAMDASAASAPTPDDTTALVVGHTQVTRLAVEFYDMAPPDGAAPHLLHFQQVHGDIEDIALPTLDHAIRIDVSGTLKGSERDGTLAIKGALTPAVHDGDLVIAMKGVDMLALQPYVKRFGDDTVSHGRLDLTLDAHVARRDLHAPGHLTLTGLEFDHSGHFAGIGRRAVLAALTRDGRIDLAFTVQGRVDDPVYKLDEAVAPRVAAGMGKAVGSGVKGVVEGVGGVVKGLLGAKPAGPHDEPPSRARAAPLSAPRPSSPT